MEQQAEFLLDSSCWRGGTDEAVTFLYYSETGRNLDIPTNVTSHQWLSHAMKDEIIYFQQCWEKYVKNVHSIIPAHKIWIKNSDEKINFILWNTSETWIQSTLKEKWNIEWNRYQSWVNQHTQRKFQYNTHTKPNSKSKSSIKKIIYGVSINTTKTSKKILTFANLQQSIHGINTQSKQNGNNCLNQSKPFATLEITF